MNNEPTKPTTPLEGYNPSDCTGYVIKNSTRHDLEKRFCYHAPKGTQVSRYAEIRAACLALGITLSERVPPSRELSTALTHLDAVMMYANAGIARNEQ
jgi:hypothetical protein